MVSPGFVEHPRVVDSRTPNEGRELPPGGEWMERYIGMDVHAASCTLAVISEKGRRLRDFPVETNGLKWTPSSGPSVGFSKVEPLCDFDAVSRRRPKGACGTRHE